MTSIARFNPVSLIIDTAAPWRQAHSSVLRQPSAWHPQLSRVVVHETVHYWQQLSQGFLARMAEEDWRRLQVFKDSGEIQPAGPLRHRYVEVNPHTGFSAHDLVESLARFWDVHIMGPPDLIEAELRETGRFTQPEVVDRFRDPKKRGLLWEEAEKSGYSDLAYDLAMEMAAGSYAKPYLLLREQTNPMSANVLFPIFGHAALHTADPVAFFNKLVETALPKFEFPRGKAIEELWRDAYFPCFAEATRLHKTDTGEYFKPADVTIEQGALMEHPGYRFAFHARGALADFILTYAEEEFYIAPDNLPAEARAIITIDFLHACPGIPNNRAANLLAFTAPPCVRFLEGKRWVLGKVFKNESDPNVKIDGVDLGECHSRAADAIEAVERDWMAFRQAARGH